MADLLDSLTRHQIYLEGLKLGRAAELSAVTSKLYFDIRNLLQARRYDELGGLSRTKLNMLLRELRGIQGKVWNTWINDEVRFLMQFIAADEKLFEDIAEDQLDEAGLPTKPDDKSIGAAALWALAGSVVLGANGQTVSAYMRWYASRASVEVEQTVRRAWVQKWTTDQTLQALNGNGTSPAGGDGSLIKVRNGLATLTDTVMQSVSTTTQTATFKRYAQSFFLDEYMWSSVIDAVTTDICRGRNGNVYVFGKGPIPPAHYRCRSKIIPLIFGRPKPGTPSYADWMNRQPKAFRDDVLNEASNNANGSFKPTKPLTLEQFSSKRDLILGTEEDNA